MMQRVFIKPQFAQGSSISSNTMAWCTRRIQQHVYNNTHTTTHVHLVSVGVHVEDAAEDGDGLGPSTRRRTGAGELVQQEQGSREQGGGVYSSVHGGATV